MSALAQPAVWPAVPACLPATPQDFRARIRKYEDGYETIMDRTLHYIKLIDMVTGRRAASSPVRLWK